MASATQPGMAGAPPPPLVQRHCRPLGPDAALDASAVEQLLQQLPEWRIEGDCLIRIYSFADHWETMAFVNATAWVTHREDHHPELAIGYDRCQVRFTTHSVGGLSENDFICAAKFDALLALC
ncbi:MAG: 4a-hydroxytetrahydrobiopterin dehydratase [bacterium]|jgi:4a-hydroxytetrahydrobiopterin dehydratase|nr:4a-hydroxytetrahydrobiopterin dehydratase [Betaproteobacteria bacterium]